MKLTWKLTIWLAATNCLVFGLYGLLAGRREADMLARDMERDAHLAGAMLLATVEEDWREQGKTAALRLVEEAGQPVAGAFEFRWQDREALGRSLTPAELDRILAGRPVHRREERALHTYVPFSSDPGRGALELIEPLETERGYVRSSTWRLALATGASIALSALLGLLLGAALVGRPVDELVRRMEEIGVGQLEVGSSARRGDELGRLGAALDRLARDLEAARREAARQETERLSVLRQLRHAERLATVGRLASGVAHELGTPLNVILARAQLIEREEGLGERARAHAGVVREQTQRMTRTIRQLLDFARRGESRLREADLRELSERCLAMLEPLARKRGVALAAALPAAPCPARADPEQLEQVLTNLVINAVHASPSGSAVRVSLEATRAAPPPEAAAALSEAGRLELACWRLSVVDEGEGIAPEVLPRIFEPFFTTKDVGEGTGLGLPVAHGIVAEHEGWISVASAPRQGARFEVYLPREEVPT
ncbi:MAG: sensor histidine kinase [Planctomycetota bacterium]